MSTAELQAKLQVALLDAERSQRQCNRESKFAKQQENEVGQLTTEVGRLQSEIQDLKTELRNIKSAQSAQASLPQTHAHYSPVPGVGMPQGQQYGSPIPPSSMATGQYNYSPVPGVGMPQGQQYGSPIPSSSMATGHYSLTVVPYYGAANLTASPGQVGFPSGLAFGTPAQSPQVQGSSQPQGGQVFLRPPTFVATGSNQAQTQHV